MKNDLIKGKSDIFKFIDDLNSINDGGEFETNYCDISSKELELGQENTDKNEASFLDLVIKIRNRKFQVGRVDKRDSFPFSIVRTLYKSINVTSNIFYSAISAESLKIARTGNSPGSFSTKIKPFVTHMRRKVVPVEKINRFILQFFNKHQ